MKVTFIFSIITLIQANPRLLIHQQVLNKHVVANREVLVKYTIFNSGTQKASNVELKTFFDSEQIEFLAGNATVRFSIIEKFSNLTYVVIIKPKFSSSLIFNTNISYFHKTNKTTGFTAGFPEVNVSKFHEYCRKHACNAFELLVVLLTLSFWIVIPFLLFFISRNIKILF
jgi:translocon-associated protein subunit beta